MRNTFRVLFYIKKNALLRNGQAPIMCRITINGMRTQLTTRLSVLPTNWEVGAGRVAGRSVAACRTNERLSAVRLRIEDCYEELFRAQRFVTPQMVKEVYFGNGDSECMLLGFFRRHNEEFLHMVGVSRSKASYYKYRCVYNHLRNFISERYAREDLFFQELDKEFLTGFHLYIVRGSTHKTNTTWVYMTALKHIFMLARAKGLLARDLFAGYKLRSEFVPRNYLSIEEVKRLRTLTLSDPTQQLVRDAFLFSCFTGLAYADVRALVPENVQRSAEQVWIATTRRKTGAEVNVRLFAVPCGILSRYAGTGPGKQIFNLPSNGWCNACLEKIMLLAGIDRHITFHAARHTFATTITLSQGVAIETISKLLGHRNIRTTQIYATITRSRLCGEMERLSRRIDALCGAGPGSRV